MNNSRITKSEVCHFQRFGNSPPLFLPGIANSVVLQSENVLCMVMLSNVCELSPNVEFVLVKTLCAPEHKGESAVTGA